MPIDPTILIGRITHLRFTLDFTAEFRISGGVVLCRAFPPYSLSISEKRGYPGHTVRVAGSLSVAGKKNVLAVQAVDLVD